MSLRLTDLNHDCLRMIMEKLKFEDQLSMAHVCQQMKIIAADIWQHSNCQTLTMGENLFNEENFNKRAESLREYIQCICDNVEILIIAYDGQIVYLENIKFSNVHTLLIYMSHSSDDERLYKFQKLIKILPNLITLKLDANCIGEHLWMFENIEELDLSCDYLQTKYFKEIFLKLKNLKKLSILFDNCDSYSEFNNILLCTNLEEIRIKGYNLIDISEELLKLKKLRKIVCHADDDSKCPLLRMIINRFGNFIHTMMFHMCFTYIEICEGVQKMITLRRLVFDNESITKEQLCNIGASLGHTLEEFYFRDNFFYGQNYDGLLDLIRECTKLKILDLTGKDIDRNFVEKLIKIIAFDDEKRKQKLVMYCGNTNVTNEDLKMLKLPENLKISFKEYPLDLIRAGDFHCEWSIPADGIS